MARLSGKIAFITGADSGMGQAIAEEFARESADIIGSFHSDSAGADETRRRVESHGRRALFRQLDVRDEASISGMLDAAADEMGMPHILVNNAGVGGGSAKVAEMTTEDLTA